MAIDPISIASIIIAITTAASTLFGVLHLRKSKCLGSECLCESENKKIERIKSIIQREGINIPIKNIVSQPTQNQIINKESTI